MATTEYPVDPEVTVHAGETIYRTDEWWKAAVTHSFRDSDPEIGIYLWHRDGDWSRKNKYHVKTAEAWHDDKERIEQYLATDGSTVEDQSDFPVSDYYTISQAKSVFQTDEWWKAIVLIDEKGTYETQEVIIYLWQLVDDDWRRRQKYAIKNTDDWSDDYEAVNALLDDDSDDIQVETHDRDTGSAVDSQSTIQPDATDDIMADVESEVKELHLGSGVGEES